MYYHPNTLREYGTLPRVVALIAEWAHHIPGKDAAKRKKKSGRRRIDMRLIPGRDDNCVGVPLNGNGSGVAMKGSVRSVIIDHCPDAGSLCDNQNTASVPEFLYGNRNAEYCSCQWNATAVKGFMGAKIDASVSQLKNTPQKP